jgi:hypothetical protein
MKQFVLAGRVPYLATLVLAATGFILGRATVPQPRIHFAVAEKGAVVLEALFGQQEPDEAQVTKVLQHVLDRYADAGYAVIDVSKDEQGGMAVAALPPDAIDITQELRRALRLVPPLAAASASTDTHTDGAEAATRQPAGESGWGGPASSGAINFDKGEPGIGQSDSRKSESAR